MQGLSIQGILSRMAHLNARRGLMVCMTLAFALSVPAFGADAAKAPPRTPISIGFSSPAADSEFEDVFYLSIAIILADRGYPSVKAAPADEPVLLVGYEVSGRSAMVRLELAEGPGRRAASAEGMVRLTLELDADLEILVDDLLGRAVPQAPSPALAGSDEATKTSSGVEAASEPPEAVAIGGLFSSELLRLEDTLRTTDTRRLEALARAGVTSFVGGFADYARLGATAALDVAALRLDPAWSLSVGGRASATRAFMNLGVTGGTMYLATIGPDLRAGIGARQAQRLSVGLSGGVAILALALDDGTTLARAEPFVDAGVQAGVPLGRDFFLGLDARFVVVFDPEMLIMGTSPTITLFKEI